MQQPIVLSTSAQVVGPPLVLDALEDELVVDVVVGNGQTPVRHRPRQQLPPQHSAFVVQAVLTGEHAVAPQTPPVHTLEQQSPATLQAEPFATQAPHICPSQARPGQQFAFEQASPEAPQAVHAPLSQVPLQQSDGFTHAPPAI